MNCAACSSSIEQKLRSMDGISKAGVNLTTNTASVDYDETAVSQSEISAAIEDLGFSVLGSEDGNAVSGPARK